MIQGHGGNIYALARELGCRPEDITDVSSNINPLGPPPGLLAHLKEHISAVCALPEVDSHTISTRMAALLGVPESGVLAGAGTTQFIYTLFPALGSRRVLIVGPTYADYADACRMHRLTPEYFLTTARENFQVDLDLLDGTVGDFDTVVICNPNNPTGRLIAGKDLVYLCRRHPRTHFVIDESYLAFAAAGNSETVAGCGLDNVSVLHSLSKIYRLPGLRIGFLVASEKTIDRFKPLMTPWRLNSLAGKAVEFLWDHRSEVDAFVNETRLYLQKEGALFSERLMAARGLTLFPSHTSYFLMALPTGRNAVQVCSRFARAGILIRNCSNFTGLDDTFIRIALNLPDINAQVADILLQL